MVTPWRIPNCHRDSGGHCASDGWPGSLASKCPGNGIAPDDSFDRLAEIALEHRPPRDQRELAAFLDQRKAAAREVEATPVDAFDPLATLRLSVGEPKLARKLGRDAAQFPAAQNREQVAAIYDPVLLLAGQPLLHQPLPPARERLADFVAEPRNARGRGCIGYEVAVEPGCPSVASWRASGSADRISTVTGCIHASARS